MVTGKQAPQSKKPKRTRAQSEKAPSGLAWIIELGKDIPPEEQARHPVDGAAQKHHYLHGHPKQD